MKNASMLRGPRNTSCSLSWWLCGGVALTSSACKSEPSAPKPPPAVVAAADAALDVRAEDAALLAQAVKGLEGEAKAVLSAWEAAQNAGDFAAYQALYAEHFTGVRRSGPRTRNFDRSGWLDDRKRMFSQPLVVDFEVEQSTDQGAAIAVLGTQSFRAGNYQDRGQKRFVLAREGGQLRIVREEMLASELGEAPTIAARMVVDVQGGPVLAIIGRASAAVAHGPRVSAHATYPSASVYEVDRASAPADARAFLEGPLQLVGTKGSCSTRAKALRLVHVTYAHSGQVMQWRGEDTDAPKPTQSVLADQIKEFDPDGFWAVELESRCTEDPLVLVPGAREITVFTHAELPPAERGSMTKRFAQLPFVRALASEERAQVMDELAFTRFSSGSQVLVSAESIAGCSAPVVHALFDMEHAGKLGFRGDQGGLEHIEAVADLDGDGQPEIIARSAIGADTWGVVDFAGKQRLVLRIPYFDCPC